MITLFPPSLTFQKLHTIVPPYFILMNASNLTLGRLICIISTTLRSKIHLNFFTPGFDQGNFVLLTHLDAVQITGKKAEQKKYYRSSNRPGGLKNETFKQLKARLIYKIFEHAIWGMLPKTSLGRLAYKRLYLFKTSIHLLNPHYVTSL